jgi:hypothetical protein
MEDGRILLHDFGGESAEAILGVVGLSFADLYPDVAGQPSRPVKRPFNASDVLSLVAHESSVAVIVVSGVLRTKQVKDRDFERLLESAQRLGNAAEVCNGPR